MHQAAKAKVIGYMVVILLLIVSGYGLFLWFVINIMKGEAAYGLLFVALVAGIAAFFNPCAFPLLPAYLAKYYTEGEGAKESSPTTIIRSGFAASLGLITFNLILGLSIGLLGAGFGKTFSIAGDTPNIIVLWFRGIVGALLMYLGISHITGRGNPFAMLGHLWHPRIHNGQTPFTKFYGYGFGYTLLGIGCGGPIMAGLLIFALSQGGFFQVLLAFGIYSLVMAVLMVLVSLLIALSKKSLLQSLTQSSVAIQKISGLLLLIVGFFLIFSSLFVSTFTRIFFP